MAIEILSRHFFRRTARAQSAYLDAKAGYNRTQVVRAQRGPFRWYVIER